MDRRSILMAAPLLMLSHAASAKPQVRYTAATAPDALTRDILSKSVPRIAREGAVDLADGISANLPQVIEQNLARLNGPRIAALLTSLRPHEATTLAQVYVNLSVNAGRKPRLYDLLALRLEGAQLGAASRYFGFAPLYEAVHRVAPGKAYRFLEHSHPDYAAPVPGMLPATKQRPTRFIRTQRAAPSIEMTLVEIYLDYRTAPVGSLGPTAAAFETVTFALARLTLWGGYGYAIGSGISYLLQTFAPEVHMRIGEGIYNFITPVLDIYQSGSTPEIGLSQMNMAVNDFDLGGIAGIFAETGGDYGVVAEWSANAGGGGCGSSLDGCPILL